MIDRWHEWRRRQRGRLRKLIIGTAAMAVFMVGLSAFIYGMLSDGASSTERMSGMEWGVVLMPAAFQCVPVVIFVFQIMRERRMLRLVPEQDGAVCPKCRCALASNLRCDRCVLDWTAPELTDYWDQYPWPRIRTHRALADIIQRKVTMQGGVAPSEAARLTDESWRKRRRLGIAGAVAIGTVMFAIVWIFIKGSFFGTLQTMGPVILFMMGMIVLSTAFSRGAGTGRCCAKCDYQLPPGDARRGRCPECGADWAGAAAVVQGRSRVHRGTVAVGIVLAAPMLLFPAADIVFGGAWRMRAIPTGVLISQVTTPRLGFTMDEWSVLATRTLTPEQEHRLFSGLLDKRLALNHVSSDAERWIATVMAGGKLPPELLDRFYREMVEIVAVEPAVATAGDDVHVSVVVRERQPLASGEKASLLVEGVYVNDAAEPVAREHVVRWLWGMETVGDRTVRFRLARPVCDVPAGPLRLRIVVWQLCDVPAVNDIEWEGSAPVLPPGGTYGRRIELEHVIDVADAPADGE